MVAQGNFTVYIDDLSSILSSCNSGCKFGNQMINHISYADDLLIFCPSSKGLQGFLNQCEIYGTERGIKYNKEKTVCMIIKPHGFNSADICLNGHMLSFVDSYKYLGLLLTYGLATRHACYAPATRPLRARYSPSIYMCGSPKTRGYILNKSGNTIIWRLNIRQVNKDLYVEVESPRQGCQSMRKCVEVCRLQYEKKPA